MDEHGICRSMLKVTMEAVRKHTTAAQRKDAWTWKDGGNRQEFQYPPDGTYWYGHACCGWYARHQGWEQWLREQGHRLHNGADVLDRKPSQHGGHIVLAHHNNQYVTWVVDRDGLAHWGHYFDKLDDAQSDFDNREVTNG